MRRSPGHTLMLCGLFWAWLHPFWVSPKSMWMTSNWSSFEASGARARFAAALTAMRLLRLMTSVVSGHPGLEGLSSFSLALACSSVGHASSPTRSHFTKLKMPGSERMFSMSSCLCPPARSRMSWLCSKGALMGRPAQESSTAGNCRKSPSSRNFTSACVISSTTSQSSFCALPPRTYLRTYLRTQWSAVCAPRPRFCAEQCVLDTRCTASPCSRSLTTIVRARCVFPVRGRPWPARQWLIGYPPRSTSVVWGAPPPCAAPGCCPATASSLLRGRPACRPGGAAPPTPAAAP